MTDFFDEQLDVWINQFLDGELSSQREAELLKRIETDPAVRERVEQLSRTHSYCQQAVDEVLKGSETDVHALVHRAGPRKSQNPRHRHVRGWLNFASGMAAGLVLTLGFQWAFRWGFIPSEADRSTPVARSEAKPRTIDGTDELSLPPWPPSDDLLRRVDWYNLTDQNGNQWLIEGWRDSLQKPASHTGDF